MIEFKALEYSDYEAVSQYFTKDNLRHSASGTDITCDLVFGTTFLWRDYYNTKYAVIDESVVLQISTGGVDMFSVPVGGNNIPRVLELIKEYAHGRGTALYFCFVPEAYLPYFNEAYDVVFTSEEPDWSDYVYKIHDLISFPGRAYHGQKNFLNRYKKNNPNAAYYPITKESAPLVRNFAETWSKCSSDNSEMALAETEAIYDLLDNWERNTCMQGGYVTSERGISGFTVAETVGDTVYIHIEKADHKIAGAYQFLSSEFLRNLSDNNILWVNREEDMGIAGLRKSKQSLHPSKMLKKYTLYCC